MGIGVCAGKLLCVHNRCAEGADGKGLRTCLLPAPSWAAWLHQERDSLGGKLRSPQKDASSYF